MAARLAESMRNHQKLLQPPAYWISRNLWPTRRSSAAPPANAQRQLITGEPKIINNANLLIFGALFEELRKENEDVWREALSKRGPLEERS